MTAETADPPRSALAEQRFGKFLLQLIGEPFLFTSRSYGDELIFHFGQRITGKPRKIKGQEYRYEHGSYRLFVRGSAWLVKSGTKLTAAGLTAELEGKATLIGPTGPDNPAVTPLPGSVPTAIKPFLITRPDVTGIGLRVELSDGSTTVIVPTVDELIESLPADVTLYEIADWELVTPDGRLIVGPSLKWTWQPSTDSPIP